MKPNKQFLMEFISCFGPSSTRHGSAFIQVEENHESLRSEGDLSSAPVNHNKKQRAGKKKKQQLLNSSDQHHWCPSLSAISEDKTIIAASVHRRSSPPTSSSRMKKLLLGKNHGTCQRRKHSTYSSAEYRYNHTLQPVMPAFAPVAFMF